jgi:hypothetical protein
MEIILTVFGLLIGVTGVGVGVWQSRLAREQLRLAEHQHSLPKPGSADFGLNAAHLDIDEAIPGMYEGQSRRNKPTNSGFKPVESGQHVEQFTITRQAEKLTIVGKSLSQATGDQSSHWSGALWKLDDTGTLFFGVELTHRGKREFGTLVVSFHGRVAEGYYYSGDFNNKFINSFKAEKVSHFSAPIAAPDAP